MFKRFRSKKAHRKESEGEIGEEPPGASESEAARGRLLSVPLTAHSASHGRSSPSPSTSGLGLHIIHQPDYAVLDIIFVHGLGGHSRKTWSKDHDPSFFWPQLWLPFEPDIASARIFTFGYNATWRGATKSISSITDFAKELLFEMRFGKDLFGEDLRLGANPIIFVVHSMGGLVVKKAYLLGLHDTNYQELVQATSAIIFLSTPHRGTNLAGILNRVLAVSFQSSKNFISDLNKSSSTIEDLNEQFRHLAPKLSIWSFYETLATPIGPRKIMVLEKESSVLGYPTEISRPLQADHHNVCKFSSPTDPSYVTVRNAIKSLVARFRDQRSETSAKLPNAATSDGTLDIEDLFLNCPSTETDYIAIRRLWIPNTCEWFLEEEKFISWFELSVHRPAILWYTAPPANGKSVLSAFVISHLRNAGVLCQYFLFKYADDAKRMVANCIKSLALQLSRSEPKFRRALAGSSRESLGLDSLDPVLIWRGIFEGILLELNLANPIYWVIDALDECDNPRIFLECLNSFTESLPIRILIFSRNTDSISMSFDRLSRSISKSRIEKSTTGHNQHDIERFVQMELDHMRGGSQFRQQLLKDIMKRSEGNFLWVKLVLEEVLGCHTEENIREVLEEIPSDMTLMFQRMEKSLLQAVRRSDMTLTKTILEWATCAQRPLNLKELLQALQPEFSGFLDFKRTVQETCGQFVQVGGNNQVTILHHTAREYFTRSSESEFRINTKKTHEKLFSKTLMVFEDEGLRWRLLQNQHALQSSEPFIFYAAASWPFHLGHSASSSTECLDVLIRVFRGPGVLVWIHVLALLRHLEVLVKASRVLATVVANTKRRNAPTNHMLHRLSDLELLNEWSIDLIKLVGRFASKIVANPGVLYDIIPAVCPPKSITHRQFHSTRNIKVIKAADTNWDDNLSRLSLPDKVRAWNIACAGKFLTVLGSNGSVYIWDASSFAELSVINHEEPVMAFALNDNGGKLCTYGLKNTKLWSTFTGELLSLTSNPPYIKALTVGFSDNDRKLLMGGDDNNIRYIACDNFQQGWQILNNDLLKDTGQIDGAVVNSPMCLAFSGDRTQVGASYRGAPLSVWSVSDGRCINTCRRANNIRIEQRQPSSNWFAVDRFTWNPVTGHILGIYKDGCIFKWHPLTEENIEAKRTADEIAASPNGKLFATSSSDGSIRVWDFAYFSIIYQLSSESLVTEIAFSPDSRRFYDLRDGFINAWESNSLARFLEMDEHISDSNSEDQSSTAISKFSEEWAEQFEAVTAFSPAPGGSSYCVGYEDGHVELHERDTTESKGFTRFYNYMPVTHVRWSPDGRFIALSDLAGDIQVWEIGQDFEEKASPFALPRPQIQRDEHNIEEILFSLDNKYILISTTENVFTCSTKDGKLIAKSKVSTGGHEKWLCHPTQSDIVLRCGYLCINAYWWSTLEEAWHMTYSKGQVKSAPEAPSVESDALADMSLTKNTSTRQTVRKVITTHDSQHILIYTSESTEHHKSTECLHIIPVEALPHSRPDFLSTPSDVVSQMLIPLGMIPGRKLVFIDRDLWLCSYPLGKNFYSPTGATYNRFYFIPRNWMTKDNLEQCVLTEDGTLFWPKGDRVVLIECSLDETRKNSVF